MGSFVLGFREIDKSNFSRVGGKGANLAQLVHVDGIHVPEGFCITIDAFKAIIAGMPSLRRLLDRISQLSIHDRDEINLLAALLRRTIEQAPIQAHIVAEIAGCINEKEAYAVRSSATAEDLPMASFAGQQDSYLNIIGSDAILTHISKCWASLFTDRAVIYRIQNGFGHDHVYLAVIIQKMVSPQAAGILFTADPITGSRKVTSIDAAFGLGEATVSGLVAADNYKVGSNGIISKGISTKKVAIYPLSDGGTHQQTLPPRQQKKQVLINKQILHLADIGRKIEAHFHAPQDIEWCLGADGAFYIVQSRPITTLFPVPEASDHGNHIYVSVGHQQMMTDAMKPLGLSFFLLITDAPMRTAGGRLFVDVTQLLESPMSRSKVISALGQSDPLIKDALLNVVSRGDFIKPTSADHKVPKSIATKAMTWTYLAQFENNPAIAADLISANEASVRELKQKIQAKSGAELFDFIQSDVLQLKQVLFSPQSLELIKLGMYVSSWINKKIFNWLGEKNVADTLSQSVSNNITSEMGLALLDIADVIRPFPQVIEYLQRITGDRFFAGPPMLAGGVETHHAIDSFLEKFGMRCPGEIDITKPRWSESPAALVPIILSNIRNFTPGAAAHKFQRGLDEALNKEQEILARLAGLPGGKRKAAETKRMIRLLRTFIGYREYPKYGIVSRFLIYKRALMREAAKLVSPKAIDALDDIFYLTFEELRHAIVTGHVDYSVINARKAEYKIFEKLAPPRVLTSDGEIVAGRYNRSYVPVNALAGLAVSAGIVEGRARVILNMGDANIEDGDILVTTFTDPSWTPLFVSIRGLVTEVGGLMTHGAVIAREYGLPAIVGVENATKLIKDGQRIRLHGTEGYVELL